MWVFNLVTIVGAIWSNCGSLDQGERSEGGRKGREGGGGISKKAVSPNPPDISPSL